MLTHIVWALYLYIGVWAFGDASENVNKVNSPRFFIVFSTALSDYENIQNDKKQHQKRITMKTLRFIGMALTAIILTIGFTACSSDDDDNNGGAGETLFTSNTRLWWAYNSGTDKYGYINENGEWAIPAQYDYVSNFSCGLARVRTGKKYYFIDTNGKIINATGFDNARDFSNNYARVKKDGVWGLIDKSGNFVIQPIYYALGDVATNGLLTFQIQSGGKKGFINTKNERVIDPEYDSAYAFNNGVACVQSGSKWGAINAEGKWVIQPIYNYLDPVIGYDLVVFEEKSSGSGPSLYGIMDYNGNIKVQALYRHIYDNETGNSILGAENTNEKCGFIDVNGNTVIPFIYDKITDFYGDYAAVRTKKNDSGYEYNNYNIIDKSGNILFSLGEKESIADAYNGMILTEKSENGHYTYTYRNKDNKIIFTWTE